ncbi:MAG: TSUP family transporter [Verrucomicrobia bacterium]|nr:TSUP family transporter [Verrucomicrobiota bacterium]MBU1910050.1 TSUP family transporter [Verrucomicrobiota bacterium]
MINAGLFLVLGLAAGVFSGILGLGGGVVIVPALVLGFGFSQHLAQGTTLALLVPPIGLLAAWTYYRHGHVNLYAALWICLGFVFGGLLGARLAITVPELFLRRAFGGLLLLLSVRMIFFK